MKRFNKKILISIFIFLAIIIFSISIIIANITNKTNFEISEEKIYYEIKYFDSQIIYMINLLNNIEGDTNFYINWEELESQTYNLYNYWNSVILDLNYLNIDKKILTNFGKILDELTVSINNMNQDNTFSKLLELYNNLIIYSESLKNNNYKDIMNTKYNLLNAYSIAEKGNWTQIYEYILKASENIYNAVNYIDNDKYTQYNINKAYISVKELENIINIKDLKLFYLKYKIAIENLENI